MKLEDRVAIITGAGNGIGAAIARRFSREGATVVCTDVNLEAAEGVATGLGAPRRALALRADVSDPGHVSDAVATTVERFGRVDIMVNNAGIAFLHKFLDVKAEDFQRVMSVNVFGTFLFGQAAAKQMAPRGSGRIINIASISGQRAGWARTAYGTSKAAIIQLTRQMAMELGPLGITANAIAPGPVDTATARAGHTARTTDAYLGMIPATRYGTVDEIASAAAFLASDEAGYVNGHVLDVDGGYMAAGVKFDDF